MKIGKEDEKINLHIEILYFSEVSDYFPIFPINFHFQCSRFPGPFHTLSFRFPGPFHSSGYFPIFLAHGHPDSCWLQSV